MEIQIEVVFSWVGEHAGGVLMTLYNGSPKVGMWFSFHTNHMDCKDKQTSKVGAH